MTRNTRPQPGAVARREPLPPRTCTGYAGRACPSPDAFLSAFNMETLCAVCSRRRGDAIVEAGNLRRGNRG